MTLLADNSPPASLARPGFPGPADGRESRADRTPPGVLGICEWFHFGDYAAVKFARQRLREAGVTHLRTGVSWADWHRPGGRDWHRWLLETLLEFDLLVSVWHTPPSLSENGRTTGPPRRLLDYADFLWLVLDELGDLFTTIELWNEPTGHHYWDFPNHDPLWKKFSFMVHHAAKEAKRQGFTTVLGGIVPVDESWLWMVRDEGALDHIDVLSVHGFPHMWGEGYLDAEGGGDVRAGWDDPDDWFGWAERIDRLRYVAEGRPVWITETGLATWDPGRGKPGRHALQARALEAAADAAVERDTRVYWYSMLDLHPARPAVEGFHADENEYHLGLCDHQGNPKPAYHTLRQLMASRDRRPQISQMAQIKK